MTQINNPLVAYAIKNCVNNVYENYIVVNVIVAGKTLRALVDTGSQPTVIKRSCVPIGTPIMESNLYIKGVKGPTIKVCGTSNIHFEVGDRIFTLNCVVVNDEAIDFPAETSIIMGLDLLAGNQLDVSTSRWALVYQNELVKRLEPAIINGKTFTCTEQDYACNAGLIPNSELQIENGNRIGDVRTSADVLYPEIGVEGDGNDQILESNRIPGFYPNESELCGNNETMTPVNE